MLHIKVSRPSVLWFQRLKFLKVLPYMGIAAMLVMLHGQFEKNVPSTPGGSTRNLVTTGSVGFKKILKLSNYRGPKSRSKTGRDLLYSRIVMYSLRQLLTPIVRH